jgi:autotransporter strand-loop-strand O-heptosyltransferase
MSEPKIFAHASYVGTTGYNQHTRDFFRKLSSHCKIKVRNFTVGSTWEGYNLYPHDKEPYINDIDKSMLYQQILWTPERKRENFSIYPSVEKEFSHDVNLVLCETNHYIFYDEYVGPKIAYNVWETTLQPEQFFKRLKEFDELWVPSKWQRDCTIAQGYDPNKIKVVPEGVDDKVFFPNPQVKHQLTSDGRFKFFLAGRWDYRKSIKEIIETFLNTFDKDEPVDLIVSVDNPFSNDGLKSTEERLKHYNLDDPRIKVVHFLSRTDYVDILKSCNCFVSCARSEGWNLPLIESMACGTPSIYSNCSGQLEFAEGKGIPVNILGEKPANQSSYNHFNEMVGNYYEPDFIDLSVKMRGVYENYEEEKTKSLKESIEIREKFDWENIAEVGYETIKEFLSKNKHKFEKKMDNNRIQISYLDGPKVEILGNENNSYKVEFINKTTGEILHSETIKNNMWVACGKKYFIPWQIKINGIIHDEFSLENKRVLISLESKSIGDTLAWAPYSVEFQKKHNCTVVLSTFHNEWFKNVEAYKNIEFIEPGQSTPCSVVYRIGWFRDKNNKFRNSDMNPNQVNLIPLQKTATDILGLDYIEVNHGIKFKPKKRPIENKYVVIGPISTAGLKEWPYENWSELSKLLNSHEYIVVSLTKDKFNLPNVANYITSDWNEIFNYLYHSEFFIGLSSGLSWVNWALNKHTFMISGFSKDEHEFQKNVTRFSNQVCIKCWNDPVLTFDGGDWDWCPVYKGTEMQHICQKSITTSQVYYEIKKFIYGN